MAKKLANFCIIYSLRSTGRGKEIILHAQKAKESRQARDDERTRLNDAKLKRNNKSNNNNNNNNKTLAMGTFTGFSQTVVRLLVPFG